MTEQEIISELLSIKANSLETASRVDKVLTKLNRTVKRKKTGGLTEDQKRELRNAMKKTELRRSSK